MRPIFAFLCVASLTTAVLAADKPADQAKSVPLFDGKTLDGWEGNLKVFRIQDGAIVGGDLKKALPHNEFLCTTKQYGDFELRLKFKLLGNGVNAGVQIRTRRIPNHHEVVGYQADLAEGMWGNLYDEGRRGFLAGLPPAQRGKNVQREDWNDYLIRCEGKRVQLWINGRQTVDYAEGDAAIPLSGVIGLQIHGGPPSEAWYKDIAIRQLPAK
jgi:hypothetical protein